MVDTIEGAVIYTSTSCRVTWIKKKAEFISEHTCLSVLRSSRIYSRIYRGLLGALLVVGSKDDEVSASISGSLIQETDEEKLLAVTLDSRLNFKNYSSNLCKKAIQKLLALARLSEYMEKSKLELTMTSFVMSQSVTVHLFGCFLIGIL